MAKQMVYEDEARQPLAAGVSKLARAVDDDPRAPAAATRSSTRAGAPPKSPRTA